VKDPVDHLTRESVLPAPPVATLGERARSGFLIRTYLHLYGAIVAFTVIEALLFVTGTARALALAMLGTSWLVVLGGFVIVSWLASHAAHRATSLAAQYGALAVFVVAEAVVFVPLMFVAEYFAPGAIISSALTTILGFGVLTGVVLWTRQDLSFLGRLLRWAFAVALMLIVAATVTGLQLGSLFSVAMVGLAGVAILHDTSKVLHHYPEDRYVAASLELFSSVALMFWYVLRLFLGRR
jgi:FtsH-binding integral membrane protein